MNKGWDRMRGTHGSVSELEARSIIPEPEAAGGTSIARPDKLANVAFCSVGGVLYDKRRREPTEKDHDCWPMGSGSVAYVLMLICSGLVSLSATDTEPPSRRLEPKTATSTDACMLAAVAESEPENDSVPSKQKVAEPLTLIAAPASVFDVGTATDTSPCIATMSKCALKAACREKPADVDASPSSSRDPTMGMLALLRRESAASSRSTWMPAVRLKEIPLAWKLALALSAKVVDERRPKTDA